MDKPPWLQPKPAPPVSPAPPWLRAAVASNPAPSGSNPNNGNPDDIPSRAHKPERGGRSPEPGKTYLLETALVREPGTETKRKYEEFARQFMIDFSQTRAAVRMGYSIEKASQLGNHIFWQPYTQVYLTHLIRSAEEHALVSRNEVLAGLLREANRYDADATSASRVSAWKEIGRILGMYVQRVEISANSSGVMEVPMVVDVNQWETLSQQSQDKLLEAVRV